MSTANSSGLLRAIGRWDLVALVINGTIGAGIFGLPSKVYELTGTYSLVAFGLCAILVVLILLGFAEVSSRFDQTGGVYLYAREAFGPLVGFEVGWLIWLQRVTGVAVLANLLASYVGFFVPTANAGFGRAAVITAVLSVLTVANLRGVRIATALNNWFTIGKLVPLTLFITVGFFFIDWERLSFGPPPSAEHLASSVLLLVFAFAGFDVAVIPAGEIQEPRRNLPFAMMVAQSVVTVFYILIQVVCIGTLATLAQSERPLADAGGTFLGSFGGMVIAIGAIVAIFGTMITSVLAAPRILFALAEQGQLPARFAITHERYRTPHLAIWISSMVMLAVALSGTFIYAVTVNAMIRLVTYATTCIALLVFRQRRGTRPATFVLPAGTLVSSVALIASGWLLSLNTGREARDLAIAAAVGILVYAVWGRTRSTAVECEKDRR